MLKKLILAVACLSLANCAFDKDTQRAKNREAIQNEKLSDSYRPVIGTYSGKLTTETGDQEVEVTFFTLNVVDGTNADGSERLRKVLRANYRRINPVKDSYRFKVTYTETTGELAFTNSGTEKLGSDDIHTIDTTLKGEEIIGEAKSETRVIGILHLKLTSRSSESGGGTEENDYYQRLRKQLEAIAGLYQGEVLMGSEVKEVTVNLTVVNVIADGGGRIPRLSGTFAWTEDRSGSASLNLAAVYEPDLNPPKLTMAGVPRSTTTSYKAIIEGTLVNTEFTGTFSTNVNGLTHPIKLKKVQ